MIEELADMCVEDLREGINIESKFIQAEHELHMKLCSVDNAWGFLEEHIPKEDDHLHELNHIIYTNILDIREFIDANELQDISFFKEEKHNLLKLDEDIKHQDWQVVKKDLSREQDTKTKMLRVQKHHLKELHHKFKVLAKEMSEHSVLKAISKDTQDNKEKHKYARLELHYFMEIYKFISFYEHILEHMLKKEEHLFRKENHDSKKLN